MMSPILSLMIYFVMLVCDGTVRGEKIIFARAFCQKSAYGWTKYSFKKQKGCCLGWEREGKGEKMK